MMAISYSQAEQAQLSEDILQAGRLWAYSKLDEGLTIQKIQELYETKEVKNEILNAAKAKAKRSLPTIIEMTNGKTLKVKATVDKVLEDLEGKPNTKVLPSRICDGYTIWIDGKNVGTIKQ